MWNLMGVKISPHFPPSEVAVYAITEAIINICLCRLLQRRCSLCGLMNKGKPLFSGSEMFKNI